MSLDGGSAAPPTADVPTCGSRLVLSPDDPFPTFQECGEPAGHRGPHSSGACSWTAVDRSGAAGEPEATDHFPLPAAGLDEDGNPYSDVDIAAAAIPNSVFARPVVGVGGARRARVARSVIDALRSAGRLAPTQDPVTTPDHGPASTTAAGVTVPDEAVEAAIGAAVALYVEWRQQHNREAYVNLLANNVARRAVAVAAPLIVEAYLRQQICEAAHPAPGVVGQAEVFDIPEATRARVGDAWREMYPGMTEHDYRLRLIRPGGGQVTMRRGATADDVVRYLRERADELERDGMAGYGNVLHDGPGPEMPVMPEHETDRLVVPADITDPNMAASWALHRAANAVQRAWRAGRTADGRSTQHAELLLRRMARRYDTSGPAYPPVGELEREADHG